MPSFSTTRTVAHSAADMFDLVADVEAYPRFVPLCERLRVLERRVEGETEILVAEMTVAYKLIRETFQSRVTLDRPGLAITVDYLEGPFRHLHNRWTFRPIGPDSSGVDFSIDYEFRSRALATVMGAVFERAFRRFADAFEARADLVYGT